jgi:ABC-type multidrug transport system fused ATPase/permease subunit
MTDQVNKLVNKVETKLKKIHNDIKSEAQKINEKVEAFKENVQEDVETLELFDTYRTELYYLPVIEEPQNLYCFLLNVFLPGFGTMYAAFLSKNPKDKNINYFIGLFQLLTALYVIGWVFSIIWGFFIFKRGTGIMKYVKKKYQ